MAREVIERIFDDLDGRPDARTVRFALDGQEYEIDLCDGNEKLLRHQLSVYMEKGTKVQPTPSRARTPGGRAARARQSNPTGDKDTRKAIRDWAAKQGTPLAPRGRIANEIAQAYYAAAPKDPAQA